MRDSSLCAAAAACNRSVTSGPTCDAHNSMQSSLRRQRILSAYDERVEFCPTLAQRELRVDDVHGPQVSQQNITITDRLCYRDALATAGTGRDDRPSWVGK